MTQTYAEVIEDPGRLNAVYNLQLLDTPVEEAFDRLTALALQTIRVPCAYIGLLDHDREFLKSVRGLTEPFQNQREIPLEHSLCPYVAMHAVPLVAHDLNGDLAPMLSADLTPLKIESCVSIPLKSADGHVLGSFSVADYCPRQWTTDDLSIMTSLANLVMTEIDLRTELIARYRNEAQLRSYTEELEQVNAELDAYGHTIAHDLKDPINVIMGFAVLLQMDARLPDDLQEYVSKIITASYSMTEMIDQLLRLAKLRNANAEVEPVEMESVLRAVRVRLEHKLTDERVRFIVERPLHSAMGHSPWVEEVFANLIANAINYADSRKPEWRVTVRSRRLAGRTPLVRYEVEDNGIGIRAEDQARLFSTFSRLETVKTVKGTGLGLSIVHRIITRLGGEVGVESVYGEGSTFWFTLPAVRPAED